MGANSMYLTQRRYIADILRQAKMDLAKPCTTPMATTIKLSRSDTLSTPNTSMYRSIIGSLHYLSLTRPDIAYAVHQVSKFMHDPRDYHWQAVKRILCYLKHTISGGLFLSKNSTQIGRAHV